MWVYVYFEEQVANADCECLLYRRTTGEVICVHEQIRNADYEYPFVEYREELINGKTDCSIDGCH